MDERHAYLARLRMARKRVAAESGDMGYHQRPENNIRDIGISLYLERTILVPVGSSTGPCPEHEEWCSVGGVCERLYVGLKEVG